MGTGDLEPPGAAAGPRRGMHERVYAGVQAYIADHGLKPGDVCRPSMNLVN